MQKFCIKDGFPNWFLLHFREVIDRLNPIYLVATGNVGITIVIWFYVAPAIKHLWMIFSKPRKQHQYQYQNKQWQPACNVFIISWRCSFLDSNRKQIHIVVSPVLQKNLIPNCPSALPYRFPRTPSLLTRGLQTLFMIAYSRHALHLVLFCHFLISCFHSKVLVSNWTIGSNSRIERVIHGVVWGTR